MLRHNAITLISGSILFFAITAACTVEQAEVSEQIDPQATATNVPTPVEQSEIRTTATPTAGVRISIDPNADPATVTVDTSQLEPDQILSLAKAGFMRSNSYLADISVTRFFEDSPTTITNTRVELGPNSLAHANEFRGDKEIELLYVKGFGYERPANQPDLPWLATGRAYLDAIESLQNSIRGIRADIRLALVDVREENGRKLIELSGSFNPGDSGPPPAVGFKRTLENAATIIIDATSMLPVYVKINYVFETRDLDTDELLFVFGRIVESTISNYEQVVVTADYPTNLVVTTTPTQAVPVTPTATPTPTPAPAATPVPIETRASGAMMNVRLENSGPATFVLDSADRLMPRRG